LDQRIQAISNSPQPEHKSNYQKYWEILYPNANHQSIPTLAVDQFQEKSGNRKLKKKIKHDRIVKIKNKYACSFLIINYSSSKRKFKLDTRRFSKDRKSVTDNILI